MVAFKNAVFGVILQECTKRLFLRKNKSSYIFLRFLLFLFVGEEFIISWN